MPFKNNLPLISFLFLLAIINGTSSAAGRISLCETLVTRQSQKLLEERYQKKFGVGKSNKSNPAVLALNRLKNGATPTSKIIQDLTEVVKFEFYRLPELHQLAEVVQKLNQLLSNPSTRRIAANHAVSLRNMFSRSLGFELWFDLIPANVIETLIVNIEKVRPLEEEIESDRASAFGTGYNYGKVFVGSMDLLNKILPSDSPAFEVIANRIRATRSALRLVEQIDALPQPIQAALRENWLTTEQHPPRRLADVRLIYSVDHDLIAYCGSCTLMRKGHEDTLTLYAQSSSWTQNSLIYIGKDLLGSIKWRGDPSLLALNNFTNRDGKLVIAAGMTYHPSKALIADLSKERKIQLPKDYGLVLAPNYAITTFGGDPFRDVVNNLRESAHKGLRRR